MSKRFLNVIAHLDIEARVHESNAHNPHHDADERKKSEYLVMEYADAIAILSAAADAAAPKNLQSEIAHQLS